MMVPIGLVEARGVSFRSLRKVTAVLVPCIYMYVTVNGIQKIILHHSVFPWLMLLTVKFLGPFVF